MKDKYKNLLLAIMDEIDAIAMDNSETAMERIATIREVCARVVSINDPDTLRHYHKRLYDQKRCVIGDCPDEVNPPNITYPINRGESR